MSTTKAALLAKFRACRQSLETKKSKIRAQLSGKDLDDFNERLVDLDDAIVTLRLKQFEELADSFEPLAAQFEAGMENMQHSLDVLKDLKKAAQIATEAIKIAVQLAKLVI